MRTVAIVLVLAATGLARAEQDPVTGRPVPSRPLPLTPLAPPQRIVINPRPGAPVIYIDGVRRPAPPTVKLTPTRRIDCRRLPRQARTTTCRITY